MMTEPKLDEAKLEELAQAKIDAGDADLASMAVVLQLRQLRLLKKVEKQLSLIERSVGSMSVALFTVAEALRIDDRVTKAWAQYSKEAAEREWEEQNGLGLEEDR